MAHSVCVHSIARHDQIGLIQHLAGGRALLVVFQQHAADARRNANALYACNLRQRLCDFVSFLKKEFQPGDVQAQSALEAADRRAVHPFLSEFFLNHVLPLPYSTANGAQGVRARSA